MPLSPKGYNFTIYESAELKYKLMPLELELNAIPIALTYSEVEGFPLDIDVFVLEIFISGVKELKNIIFPVVTRS